MRKPITEKGKEIVIGKNIVHYDQFHIEGKINNTPIPVLIDTGASLNMIHINLVKAKDIQESNLRIAKVNNQIEKSIGKIKIIIAIASQEILVEFEIFEDNANKCILGTPWLEQVKPWKIENNKITFVHKNVEFSTKRLSGSCWELNEKYKI